MLNVPTYALYGERRPLALPERLHCESIASRSRLHGWEIRPHRHEHFLQILYIRSGVGKALLDTREVDLAGPCAVVVPATHPHGFQFSRDIDGHVVTLVQQSVAAELIGAFEVPRHVALQAGTRRAARVDAALDALVAAFGGGEPWRTQALEAAVTLALASLAAGEREADAAAPSGRGRRHASRFADLVERHFRETREIGWYAAQVGITPTQLNRVARGEFGASALGVIHRRLLAEARRDLAYTGLSVKQIALTLGFADAAYFSRFFARHAGRTPLAFRAAAHAEFAGERTGSRSEER